MPCPAHNGPLPGPIALPEPITEIMIELLDAHADTTRFLQSPTGTGEWDAHLDYLRALQRVGWSMLARAEVQPVAVARRAAAVEL